MVWLIHGCQHQYVVPAHACTFDMPSSNCVSSFILFSFPVRASSHVSFTLHCLPLRGVHVDDSLIVLDQTCAKRSLLPIKYTKQSSCFPFSFQFFVVVAVVALYFHLSAMRWCALAYGRNQFHTYLSHFTFHLVVPTCIAQCPLQLLGMVFFLFFLNVSSVKYLSMLHVPVHRSVALKFNPPRNDDA